MSIHITQLAENIINNERGARRTGRTSALLQACEKLDGIFVCDSHELAKHIKKKYNIQTAAAGDELRGQSKPLFYDHMVVYLLATCIITLDGENKKLKEQLFSKQINDILR